MCLNKQYFFPSVPQTTQIFVAADGNVKFEMGEVQNNQQNENNTTNTIDINNQNIVTVGQKTREVYR